MKRTIHSDAELIRMFRSGNESVFAQLVQAYKSRVYTTIYLVVKDRYVAEDLMQEVFIKAIDTIRSDRYNEEGKFLPWLLRIAHNLSIDYFRREKRYPTIELEDGSNVFNSLSFSETDAESLQIKKEMHKKLRELIRELPKEQKQVLLMRHFAEMSFQEIADTTGVSINTALGRMRYALINLRKLLEKSNIAYDKNLYPV